MEAASQALQGQTLRHCWNSRASTRLRRIFPELRFNRASSLTFALGSPTVQTMHTLVCTRGANVSVLECVRAADTSPPRVEPRSPNVAILTDQRDASRERRDDDNPLKRLPIRTTHVDRPQVALRPFGLTGLLPGNLARVSARTTRSLQCWSEAAAPLNPKESPWPPTGTSYLTATAGGT